MIKLILTIVFILGLSEANTYQRTASNPLIYYNYHVNQLADKILPVISAVIKKIGFDPLSVPSITDDFEINVWPYVNTKMNVYLPSGNLSKLAAIERHGNTSLFFRDDIIYLRIGVIHNLLEGRFNYNMYTFPIVLQGILNVTIQDALTMLYFAYDWQTSSLSLKDICIKDIRSFTVNLDNNSRLDGMGSKLANKMAPALKRKIINFGERMAYAIIMKHLNRINAELQRKASLIAEMENIIPNFVYSRANDNYIYKTMSHISPWLM